MPWYHGPWRQPPTNDLDTVHFTFNRWKNEKIEYISVEGLKTETFICKPQVEKEGKFLINDKFEGTYQKDGTIEWKQYHYGGMTTMVTNDSKWKRHKKFYATWIPTGILCHIHIIK